MGIPRSYMITMVLGLCWLSSAPAVFAQNLLAEYWTFDQYTQQNPQLQSRQKNFSLRVQHPAQAQRKPLKRPVRIAMIYPGLQSSDYWRRSQTSFEARLKEQALPYTLDAHFTKPETEVPKQAALLARALSKDPDYLIFTLDVLRHRGMIERILSRDRPKVILQNITTPLRAWDGYQPFMYVGFDHALGTQLLVQAYTRLLGKKARYALLYGLPGYVSSMRGDTFRQGYGEHYATNPSQPMAAYYTGFNRKKAAMATHEILQLAEQPEFIFSCSTDIALGVVDALKSAPPTKPILTNGWGGGENELKALQAGTLAMTVMRMNDDNGVAMAEAIALDQQGAGDQVPTIFSGEIVLITQQTSQAAIDTLRERAFRYSNHAPSTTRGTP
ncbi:substrate-binding domain-containing protein [Magnetococcus sp. PR-3]|uniref:substrate-binding domain-containing protein n=1 Tax=Magnetococcus sp. PR-3 TaxID=3120355 RepID=UPI002FCDF0C5